MEQPVGFVIARKEHKVLKLCKALHGLHQVPRAWNAKLDDTLVSLGFRRSPSEHAIYVRQMVANSWWSVCTLMIW